MKVVVVVRRKYRGGSRSLCYHCKALGNINYLCSLFQPASRNWCTITKQLLMLVAGPDIWYRKTTDIQTTGHYDWLGPVNEV